MIGRVVESDTRDRGFESRHRLFYRTFFNLLLTVNEEKYADNENTLLSFSKDMLILKAKSLGRSTDRLYVIRVESKCLALNYQKGF